jgi:formate hydrogenlyase subunit 6/NADH:ubiquinone oxidoreductase subunit I
LSTFDGEPLGSQDCGTGCLRCVDVCPTGALYRRAE